METIDSLLWDEYGVDRKELLDIFYLWWARTGNKDFGVFLEKWMDSRKTGEQK